MAAPGYKPQLAIIPTIGSILSNVNFSLIEILKGIPLIGNLFRGSTQHVDYDTAVAKSNEVAGQFIQVYDQLDDAGKDLMYRSAKQYFTNDVLTRFGSWWGNAISNDFAGWTAKGWLADKRQATYHYMGQPVFYFMRFEDSTRLEETFSERYTTRVDSQVWQPIKAYVENRYGTTLEDFQLSKDSGGQVNIAGFSFKLSYVLIGGAVLAVLYFAFFHKR